MFRVICAGAVLLMSAGTFASAPHVVSQKGRVFAPGSLTIKGGDEVLFQNDDKVSHHVYSSTKGHEFNLETMKPGEKAAKAFAKRGRVDIRCGLHPGMRLVLTIE